MKRKGLSCILVILLLLSAAVPALAASPQLTLQIPETLPAAGQSFTVTAELSGNPGICTAQLTLHFDSSVVDCTRAAVGSILRGMLSATNPDASDGARIAAASDTPASGDGVIAEYTFKVLKSGDPAFSLEVVELADASGSPLTCTVSAVEQGTGKKIDTGSGTVSGSSGTDFTDTKRHWCREYAAKAAALGLFKGYPDGSFRPDDAVTRAQLVTVLYRMEGSPKVTATAPFTDISAQSEEFRKAIIWAYSEGIISGRSEKIFDPTASVTRQEAMKMLFAYSGGASGMELMFTESYNSTFTDSGSIASWARPAVYWAYYHELISGTSATTITPTGVATRGQLAKILVNYSEKFGN